MTYITRRAKNQKPLFGTVEVDWGHPLAPRAGCWVINEGAGQIIDLVARNNGTLGSAATWTATTQRAAIDFPGGATATIDLGTAGPSLQAHTVTLAVIFTTLPLGSGSLILARSSLGTDGWRYSFESTGQLGLAYNDGGIRGTYVDSGAGLSAITPYIYTAAWRQTDGAVDFYLNGALRSSIATTTGTIINDPARQFTIGDTFMRGTVASVYIHDRPIAAAEALWLATEPYAFLRPKVARMYSWPVRLTAAAAGGLAWKLAGQRARLAGVGGLAG